MKVMLRETFIICLESHVLKNSFGQKSIVFESLDERKQNKINILLIRKCCALRACVACINGGN